MNEHTDHLDLLYFLAPTRLKKLCLVGGRATLALDWKPPVER